MTLNRLSYERGEGSRPSGNGYYLQDGNIFGGIIAFLAEKRDEGIITIEHYRDCYTILGRVIQNAGGTTQWTDKDLRNRAVDRQAVTEVCRFIINEYRTLEKEISPLYQEFMRETRQNNGRW